MNSKNKLSAQLQCLSSSRWEMSSHGLQRPLGFKPRDTDWEVDCDPYIVQLIDGLSYLFCRLAFLNPCHFDFDCFVLLLS